jgi:phosphatidate cytidylyltransferase
LLSWRLTLGTLFIAALFGLSWLDARAAHPGIFLLPLAILLAVVSAGELLAMFRQRGHDPVACVVYAGTLLTILSLAIPKLYSTFSVNFSIGGVGSLVAGFVASCLFAAVVEMARFTEPGKATVNLALSCFAIAYVGGLISFLILSRMFGVGPGGDSGRFGMLVFASLIATVKLSDIGQYTAGRLFGKHKLAPRISPGKTWEGVLGGILFAIIGASAVLLYFAPMIFKSPQGESPPISFAATIVYAIALAAAGLIGDLIESLLKRDAGVKDSSTWLPGFGGVLDLLDSLLVAAPVAYLFWAMHWIG